MNEENNTISENVDIDKLSREYYYSHYGNYEEQKRMEREDKLSDNIFKVLYAILIIFVIVMIFIPSPK